MITHPMRTPIDLDQSARRKFASAPVRAVRASPASRFHPGLLPPRERLSKAGSYAPCAETAGWSVHQCAKAQDSLMNREKLEHVMGSDFPRDWMWSEACAMLARAEGLHRELFRPVGRSAPVPAWEPPVDVLETDHEVLVLVALPGVNPDRVEAAID